MRIEPYLYLIYQYHFSIDPKKDVVWLRQKYGGHGSWNPLRSVTTQLSNHIALKMDDAKEVLEMVQKRNKIIEIEIDFF